MCVEGVSCAVWKGPSPYFTGTFWGQDQAFCHAYERQWQKTFSYWFIWSNFFWIGARHPWEESIFHITVCSYSYREKIYYFSILGTDLFTTTSDFKEINRFYIVQYPHVKLWVLPARFCSLLLVMSVVLDPWLIPAVPLTSYSFFL